GGPQAAQEVVGAGGDRRVVLGQHLGALGPDRRHLLGPVAEAGVLRVGIHAEAAGPVPRLPDLRLVEQLGHVVVLHPGEVPDDPADRVAARLGRRRQLLDGEAVDGLVDVLGDAAVQLEQQVVDLHGASRRSAVLAPGSLPPRKLEGAVHSASGPGAGRPAILAGPCASASTSPSTGGSRAPTRSPGRPGTPRSSASTTSGSATTSSTPPTRDTRRRTSTTRCSP